ncbi:MAG: nuclear transport factor 2 family protein [Burkholderiales bacterium]|nr:nuclear transport factor 2 family protein [Burkholderiales bacterium]
MSTHPITLWHQLVQARDHQGLDEILAENVVFHSPIVHTPFVGKAILTAAFHLFFNESFRYVRELISDHDAILEFEVEIDGITVNGVDMIKWNDAGKFVEFKVMLRPLKAVNLIHQKMAAIRTANQI